MSGRANYRHDLTCSTETPPVILTNPHTSSNNLIYSTEFSKLQSDSQNQLNNVDILDREDHFTLRLDIIFDEAQENLQSSSCSSFNNEICNVTKRSPRLTNSAKLKERPQPISPMPLNNLICSTTLEETLIELSKHLKQRGLLGEAEYVTILPCIGPKGPW